MKSYEKEIINAGIRSEKWVIRQLQNLYKDSIGRITNEIEFLYERYRNEGRQSVIYQIDYQKAIGRQIKAHLELLQEKEYETISEYLEDCYKGGYIGTMYSLQRQGIPLVIPFNQEQVINAIVHDSKINKGLYESLGENITQLKNKIRVEISRGIANNYTYTEVARNLANNTNIGMNNAIRIARTEGHRIREQSQMDASNKAKEKGADVVKQWCSILDSKTRNTHALLDGQIRELDEPFEVNGLKAMCPGQFGKASEDINCRCTMLQRAKWALDEDELNTLKERAEFFELDKTKDFEGYKKKYLNYDNIHDKSVKAHELAVEKEPKISKDIQSSIKENGGELAGFQYRLKQLDSLERKVKTEIFDNNINVEEALDRMYDNVRYTSISSVENMKDHYYNVISSLESKGYKLVRVKNTLANPNAAYRGINCVLEDANGYKFELQFHTQQSLDIKEINHKLYEEQRKDGISSSRFNELNEIMKENASSIDTPNGIEEIESFNKLK